LQYLKEIVSKCKKSYETNKSQYANLENLNDILEIIITNLLSLDVNSLLEPDSLSLLSQSENFLKNYSGLLIENHPHKKYRY